MVIFLIKCCFLQYLSDNRTEGVSNPTSGSAKSCFLLIVTSHITNPVVSRTLSFQSTSDQRETPFSHRI
jgi:hypothetical protein